MTKNEITKTEASSGRREFSARYEEMRRAMREEALSDENSFFYIRKGRAEALIETFTDPQSSCAKWGKPLMLERIRDIAADPFSDDVGNHLQSIPVYVELAIERYYEERPAKDLAYAELDSRINKILKNGKAMESLSLDYKRKLYEAQQQMAGEYQSLGRCIAVEWDMAAHQCVLFEKLAQDESVQGHILDCSLCALAQAHHHATTSQKRFDELEKSISEKIEICWTQLKINELLIE